ncbi:hypothetical protein BC835DRAFT_1308963 [Cytidiella melzeri]|nr:hypothetical protein BC835DRAFT_1308963 [Cytidiella melzeri]
MSSSTKQHNLYVTPFDINANTSVYSPWSPYVQYDHRGRLQPYVETSEQRRARLEFLRKREFSRRISAWLEDSSKSESSETDSRPRKSSSSSSSDADSLHTIDEDDEAEPDVIYSTSPANSRWISPPTSATTNNTNNSRPRHLRASSRTSSFSSLSSISEEDGGQCV